MLPIETLQVDKLYKLETDTGPHFRPVLCILSIVDLGHSMRRLRVEWLHDPTKQTEVFTVGPYNNLNPADEMDVRLALRQAVNRNREVTHRTMDIHGKYASKSGGSDEEE